MANSRSGESVLKRAMRILSTFDADNPRLTSIEIHRRSGLPQSTAHRLANEMCDVGMLQRLHDGTYIISPQAWEIFVRSNPLERLRFRAQPILSNLHHALGHYVSLISPDFDSRSILYVERFDAGDNLEILGRHAARLDMHTTSTGLVMMAFASDKERERVLSRPFRDSLTGVLTDPEEIREMLPGIRRAGYTHLVGGMVAENTSFAVPVFGSRGQVIAAVGVVAYTEEAEPGKIITPLRIAGEELTLSLKNVPDLPRSQ